MYMKKILIVSVLTLMLAASVGTGAVAQLVGSPSGTASPVVQPPVVPLVAPDSPVPPNQKQTADTTLKEKLSMQPPGTVMLPMTIMFRPWQGLITIYGLANGNNPANFIVATGLNMSTVSPEDAIRLQLTTSESKAHVALLDASTEAPTASILNLRIGAGILHNIKVAQVNLITLLTHQPVPDAPSCWLGTNWLSDYQVTIDFGTHNMILNSKAAPFPKPSGIIVPFKLKDGRPIVKVNVPGGGSYDAVVDTGMMGTLVPSDIALKVKSKKLDKKTPKVGVDIASGKMGRMVVPRISIGKAELKNLMVAYYGPAAPATANKSLGIIGLDFLRRFRVTISYAKSQMQLFAPQAVEESQPAKPNQQNNRKPGSPVGTSPFGTPSQGTVPAGTTPTGTIPH
jgi:predicted aspartyl protease